MKGLGFGLERIGVAAIRHPLIFSIVLVVVTAIAAAFIPSVKFNGNVTSVVPKQSENYKNFDRQKRDFRDFSRDVAVIIKSPRLNTASGLEDLRFMQLELAITDGISSAVSLFSIPDPDPKTGELRQFFPNQIKDLVALDLGINAGNDAQAFAAFEDLKKSVEASAPKDFEIYYSGLTPIGITILNALINDQVKLTLLGLAFGALIAMIFFRSVVAAFVCAVPPILTAIWSIGIFGLIGIPITYLTTILPTLALVLAYADGIVLYHRWNKLNSSIDTTNQDLSTNLKEAVLKIGPASALTSLTTAFAISSFALSPSEALVEFAWVGVILVIFAFLSVIVGLPVLGIWLMKIGLIKQRKVEDGRDSFGALSLKIYESKPVLISLAALVSVIALFYVHASLKPDYRITDYLPSDSQSLKAEQISNDVFGGRSLIFFSVPVVEDGSMTSQANRARLGEVTDLLGEDFKSSKVFSLHSLWKDYDADTVEKIASKLATAPETTKQGYISKDDTRMLVSLRTPSSQSITETSVLIVLGIILIGLATRSFFFAAVAAVPNLFPILLTELIIFMRGGNINVTEVVALTLRTFRLR